MSLTLAAVGSVMAALFQTTVVPYVEVGGGRPDLVLIYVAVVTVVVGLDHGLAAAFIGGLSLDVLASRPLGSTAFIMLLVAGVSAAIARVLVNGRSLATVLAVAITSLASPVLFLVLYGALRGPIPVQEPFSAIIPDAVYGSVVALLFGPLAISLHRRYFEKERVDW